MKKKLLLAIVFAAVSTVPAFSFTQEDQFQFIWAILNEQERKQVGALHEEFKAKENVVIATTNLKVLKMQGAAKEQEMKRSEAERAALRKEYLDKADVFLGRISERLRDPAIQERGRRLKEKFDIEKGKIEEEARQKMLMLPPHGHAGLLTTRDKRIRSLETTYIKKARKLLQLKG